VEDGKDVPSELRSLCHGPILVLSNGMDRSCAATIYPVLDKPRTTGIVGAQGPQSTGDISARFLGSLYDWHR
jgi:hypothetical protein